MEKGKIRLFILRIGVAALASLCISCSTDNTTIKPLTEQTTKTEIPTSNITTDQTTSLDTTKNTAAETLIPISTSTVMNITPPAQRIRPITHKDMIAIFDELGLSIKDFTPDDGSKKESTFAGDSEDRYYYHYEVFPSDEKAQEYLEETHAFILKNSYEQTLDGTCDVFEKDGYTMIIGCGVYGDGEAPMYEVVLLVDDTVVTGFVWSIEEIDKQMINTVFIGLGYM